MNNDWEKEQREICQKYNVKFYASPLHFKLGISLNVKSGLMPINGLRHLPKGDTTGWYIWAGEELLQNPDFFVPLHVNHLEEWCPTIVKYLGLPPGWRFLVADGYEDIWQDSTLL